MGGPAVWNARRQADQWSPPAADIPPTTGRAWARARASTTTHVPSWSRQVDLRSAGTAGVRGGGGRLCRGHAGVQGHTAGHTSICGRVGGCASAGVPQTQVGSPPRGGRRRGRRMDGRWGDESNRSGEPQGRPPGSVTRAPTPCDRCGPRPLWQMGGQHGRSRGGRRGCPHDAPHQPPLAVGARPFLPRGANLYSFGG